MNANADHEADEAPASVASEATWHIAATGEAPSHDMACDGATLVSIAARAEAEARSNRAVCTIGFKTVNGDIRMLDAPVDASLGELKDLIAAASNDSTNGALPAELQTVSIDRGADLPPSERYRSCGDNNALPITVCGIVEGSTLLVRIPNVADRREDAARKLKALMRCVRPVQSAGITLGSPKAASFSASSPVSSTATASSVTSALQTPVPVDDQLLSSAALRASFQYALFEMISTDRAFTSQVDAAAGIARQLFNVEWSALTDLDLSFNKLDDDFVTALEPALRTTGQVGGSAPLRRLTLAVSPGPTATGRIGPVGAASLAAALRGNQTLTTLDLTGHRILAAGAAALATALRSSPGTTVPSSHLAHLFLAHNLIGPDGTRSLADALFTPPVFALQSLCLAYNDIGDAGGIALARALRTVGTTADSPATTPSIAAPRFCLGVLDLFGNKIGDAGVIALCDALSSAEARDTLCELRALDLSANGSNPAPDSLAAKTVAHLRSERADLQLSV